MNDDEVMTMLPIAALSRRMYFIDIYDESGEKKRFTIQREVAALLGEKDARISKLNRLLEKHGIRVDDDE